MMPAFRKSVPCSPRSTTAAMSPDWKWSNWTQGFRRPVTSTTAVLPRCNRVPVGSREPIHPARSNIFAYLPGKHGEPGRVELVMKFSLDQVDLTQVGLGH